MSRYPPALLATTVALVLWPWCQEAPARERAGPAEPGAGGRAAHALKATIVAGPFDIHRQYRSMEGPYVVKTVRVADLVACGQLTLPEELVTYLEGRPGAAPATGSSPASMIPAQQGGPPPPSGQAGSSRRELYWLQGIRLQVLDENDQLLSSGEFICHLNVDVDPEFRNQAFPKGERCGNARLITLTQGQTEFFFPRGYAVPVASDERWTFTFQAANRTTVAHRRLRHLLSLVLVKDSDLAAPVKALHWRTPYVAVATDREPEHRLPGVSGHGPDCLAISAGEVAPNMVPGSLLTDKQGRRLTTHFLVPAGSHTFRTPVSEQGEAGFAGQEMRIHAAWTHVHPLCARASLVDCTGASRRRVLTVHARTSTKDGLQIKRIDNISSPRGIDLPAGRRYELEATYMNPTGEPQDAMVALGLFFQDDRFEKPDWRTGPITPSPAADGGSAASPGAKSGDLYCGVRAASKP